jgi:NH3-dependent NAD+ synthetase
MKKILTVLCGVLVALSLFVTTGNTAKAAELTTNVSTLHEGDCGCDVSPIVGKEKTKIVRKLLTHKAFKTTVVNQLKEGYVWNITEEIEVIKDNQTGQILVGVPFINKDGVKIMAVFINGTYVGTSPM